MRHVNEPKSFTWSIKWQKKSYLSFENACENYKNAYITELVGNVCVCGGGTAQRNLCLIDGVWVSVEKWGGGVEH